MIILAHALHHPSHHTSSLAVMAGECVLHITVSALPLHAQMQPI